MHLKNNHQTSPLKASLILHLRIFSGALLFAILFSFALTKGVFFPEVLYTILFTYVQMELFFWLGKEFFKSIEVNTKKTKRIILVRLLLFYITVMAIALIFLFIVFAFQHFLNGHDFQSLLPSLTHLKMDGFFITLFIGFALGSLFFFYIQWSEALQREEALEKEKLILQNEILKKQLDPHFLFNNLNTLSSLVHHNPDLSEEFIQKLAAVYRHILQCQEKQMITVEEEIRFVEEYFFLRKIRDEEKISLNIQINGLEQSQIVPVSIQLLVENALKHNSATRQSPLIIAVREGPNQTLQVQNNLQKKMQITESSKTGLKNLNQRCRLVLNREIEIEETNTNFLVRIPIKC